MKHWYYWTIVGKWYCAETREFGWPAKGDWYLDWDEWRIHG